MIHRGKLHDAKSVAGLLYYFRYLAPIRKTAPKPKHRKKP